MFVLLLNPMMSNAENCVPVARAETAEELIAFVQGEAVETYREDRWYKVFKKDGPLEMYNPPWQWGGGDVTTPEKWLTFYDESAIQDAGTRETWVCNAIKDAEERFDSLCAEVPNVS